MIPMQQSIRSRALASHLAPDSRLAVKAPGSMWLATPSKLRPGTGVTHRKAVILLSAQDGKNVQGVPVVVLKMPYRVAFGEVLRVVGSSPVLGDWSADKGLQLTWSEGDVWVAEAPFSPGSYEFKCVVYNTDTNTVTRWEDGDNRSLVVPAEPGSWQLDCAWGATADMAAAFTPVPSPLAAEASPEEAPAATDAVAQEVEAPTGEEELLPTFLALSSMESERKSAPEAAAEKPVEPQPLAAASVSGALAIDSGASTSGGGLGGALSALLLTSLAGAAVAAFALLGPGFSGGSGASFEVSRLSDAVTATATQTTRAVDTVRTQVGSSLATLSSGVVGAAAQVSTAAQPALAAQVQELVKK